MPKYDPDDLTGVEVFDSDSYIAMRKAEEAREEQEVPDYIRDIENLIRIKHTQLAEERSLMEYQRESLASINRIVNRTKGELARLQRMLQRSS